MPSALPYPTCHLSFFPLLLSPTPSSLLYSLLSTLSLSLTTTLYKLSKHHIILVLLHSVISSHPYPSDKPYTTLHYTTLYCTILHYTILHYTTLYLITLHYNTLHYITLHYTTLHNLMKCVIIYVKYTVYRIPSPRFTVHPGYSK